MNKNSMLACLQTDMHLPEDVKFNVRDITEPISSALGLGGYMSNCDECDLCET